MRIALLIGFCTLVFLACRGKEKIPDNVIPKEKMEVVLWDLLRADQFLTDYVFNRDTGIDKKMESTRLYQRIFSMHKISKEEFRESFTYYRTHPVLFKEVMDSIGKRSLKVPPPPVDTARKIKIPVQMN